MDLSTRQRETLSAIVDTFAPGDGVAIPSASDLHVDDLAVSYAARSPRDSDGMSLSQSLSLFDNRVFCATVLGTRGQKFADLPFAERERILIDLSRSRFGQKRMLFKRLRNIALLAYYAAGGADDGHGPGAELMAAIGYPPQTPHKKPRGRAMRALRPLTPTRYEIDATTNCDVVVIGSGAGGSVAAAQLAEAGLDVIVLERGEYVAPSDMGGSDLDGLSNLFAPSPFWTENAQSFILSGNCLGGGTVASHGGYYRPSEKVLADWAARGVDTGPDLAAALDAVWQRVGVTSSMSAPSPRDELLEKGCLDLGLPVHTVQRAVDNNCDQGVECGRCGLGCRIGAKHDAGRTWLRDAEKRGARIVTGAQARSIEVQGDRARSVVARTSGGSWLTVRCSAVVLAAGAFESPALLARSGLGGQHVGKHLHLHPTATALGVFSDVVAPWYGTTSARYSDAHADLDGNGFGVIYETAPLTPAVASSYVPWRNAGEHLNVMRQLPHLSVLRVVIRDRGAGEVMMDSSGEPSVRYDLAEADRAHLRTGLDTAVRILEASGARRIFTGQQRGGDYVPGDQPLEGFLGRSHAAGYGVGEIALASFEAMSTLRMASSSKRGATNPEGQLWDVPNVVVADASMLPTASGVHPTGVIQALALRNARALAARLT
ncbi:GMC family oxidoreductase [Tsukamurella strandjordii]|uniref:GMC family oxidoreductase n=1 Tax=Tsukamurella strandjordii TaxID=147577 RepID=A0AA90NFF8_9ACTN|nr:GMC family oxidoreductase [Tsukamurella strandjordii]MDP0399432.1 GMC family oxidoreductase [Tsukamurella strandjordii]